MYMFVPVLKPFTQKKVELAESYESFRQGETAGIGA